MRPFLGKNPIISNWENLGVSVTHSHGPTIPIKCSPNPHYVFFSKISKPKTNTNAWIPKPIKSTSPDTCCLNFDETKHSHASVSSSLHPKRPPTINQQNHLPLFLAAQPHPVPVPSPHTTSLPVLPEGVPAVIASSSGNLGNPLSSVNLSSQYHLVNSSPTSPNLGQNEPSPTHPNFPNQPVQSQRLHKMTTWSM
jgi:hypothetical protein